MPLGNPTPSPAPGSQPWVPTRSYGGGAGKIMSNPWGAKTAVPKGAPMPSGIGKGGYGEVPQEIKDAFGPFAPKDPQSKAEADNLLNPNSQAGSAFKDQIAALRRRLMQSQGQQQ